MSVIILELDYLFTEFARLWAHQALCFMRFMLSFVKFNLAVLTNDFGVSFFLMFFLVALRDNLSALSASIIHSCAADFMHSKLGHFYLAIASRTLLSWFC